MPTSTHPTPPTDPDEAPFADLRAVPADFAPPVPAGPDPDEYLADSLEAEELYTRAVAEAAAGDRGRALVQFLRVSTLAEGVREWYLAATASEAVADILAAPGPAHDLDRGLRMYRRAIAAYEQCGHHTEARALLYRVGLVRLRRGRELRLTALQRAELFVYWLTAGFGYRPGRVLLMAAALILAFAAVFWAAGGVTTPEGNPAPGFGTAVYLSGTTFLTIGYGDVVPTRPLRGLALVEGAVGLATISFFVVVLSNRLRH